jgi:hypothetical protein
VRRLAVVILGSVGVAAGCGGDSRRDRVERYIEDANAIQQRSARDFSRANALYRDFSDGTLNPKSAPAQLERAEQQIWATRTRLVALKPPPDVRELHRRLLKLYAMNGHMAHETTQFARYVPRLRSALRPLTVTNRRLRDGLRTSGAAAQSAALDEYVRDLERLLDRLRALRPPPILRAGHRAQVERLASTRSVAQRLRTAIVAQDAAAVSDLLDRLRRLAEAEEGDDPGARSVRLYNERYRALSRAAQDVQRERVRVDRSLD